MKAIGHSTAYHAVQGDSWLIIESVDEHLRCDKLQLACSMWISNWNCKCASVLVILPFVVSVVKGKRGGGGGGGGLLKSWGFKRGMEKFLGGRVCLSGGGD